ncbi:MAG TPA: hypothetical protein VIM75_08660 [Ohtaekwangia sp.]|uniref:hypothetical protein n=1 Tax=Ohtaekwangia sp. TaxID=2066019 RepID=UPI002F958582
METLIAEYGSVVYDRKVDCLHLTCKGFLSYEELVELLERAYKLILRHQLSKCLINLQKIEVYPEGATEYLQQVWYLNMIAGGIQHVAYVVPDDVFGSMAMKEVHLEELPGLVRQYFTNEESAQAWLLSLSR